VSDFSLASTEADLDPASTPALVGPTQPTAPPIDANSPQYYGGKINALDEVILPELDKKQSPNRWPPSGWQPKQPEPDRQPVPDREPEPERVRAERTTPRNGNASPSIGW